MDIFTTALTKVRTTPIKPKKLRVKSLSKQSAAKAVSEDLDHLENHDLYFVKEQNASKEKNAKDEAAKKNASSEQKVTTEEALAPEILHKQDVLHPKKHHKDDDEDQPHLDLYV